jgi:hypothetical protein
MESAASHGNAGAALRPKWCFFATPQPAALSARCLTHSLEEIDRKQHEHDDDQDGHD